MNFEWVLNGSTGRIQMYKYIYYTHSHTCVNSYSVMYNTYACAQSVFISFVAFILNLFCPFVCFDLNLKAYKRKGDVNKLVALLDFTSVALLIST